MSPYRSRLAGVASHLPEKRLTNFDLEKLVDTNDEWIRERTGIRSRRIAEDGVLTSDIAYEASKIALERAGIKASDLGLIMVATVTPDQPMPNTACVLQAKLGAAGSAAMDISVACSGAVYGFSIADQFVRSGAMKHVLVVGAEILHHVVNYEDRETCILFGDGAGAAVISRAEPGQDSEVLTFHLHADGSLADLFTLPAGGSAHPFSQSVLDQKLHYVRMRGREIFKHAVRSMSQACQEALDSAGMTAADISWIVPHQANVRIIEAVAKHFGIGMEKMVVEIEDVANTSAATIMIALDRAIQDGRIRRGQNLLLTAFGAGITSGSLLMRY